MGEPFDPRRHGCGGKAETGHCQARPTWDGLAYFPHNRALHRGFTCDEHRGALFVARPVDVDESSAVELARRRARHSRVVDDHEPYEREPPLATGRDALQRIDAARAYARTERGKRERWWINPRDPWDPTD